MSQVLLALERALDARHPGWAEDDAVVRAAQAQSEAFTADETARRTRPMRGLDLLAYLAYFAPRGIAAAARILPAALDVGQPRRIVDWGAGVGTASLVAASCSDARLVLIDAQRAALDVAAALLAPLDVELGAALPPGLGAGDTLLLSFSFAEMVHSQSFAQVTDPLRHAARRGAQLVLIDAGDRKSARPVQQLRDLLVDDDVAIAAPCPHRDPCPALVRERDWCHTRVPRNLTPRLAAFAERVGRDADVMACAYLVTQPRPGAADDDRPPVRVLSRPKVEKGRVRVPVCGPAGVRFLQAKRRDKAATKCVRNLDRGDRPDVDPATARGDTIHVDDAVETALKGRFP